MRFCIDRSILWCIAGGAGVMPASLFSWHHTVTVRKHSRALLEMDWDNPATFPDDDSGRLVRDQYDPGWDLGLSPCPSFVQRFPRVWRYRQPWGKRQGGREATAMTERKTSAQKRRPNGDEDYLCKRAGEHRWEQSRGRTDNEAQVKMIRDQIKAGKLQRVVKVQETQDF